MIDLKANKQSVKEALHWKMNKIDFDQITKEFISVSWL